MARTRTLTLLRDEVRQRADIESATTAFPDSELTRYINQSIARLHRKIHRVQPDMLVTSTTITTAASTESYALPATFYALVGSPEVNLGGPGPSTLHRWQWADRASYLYEGGWAYGRPVAYRLVGADTISFLPIPNAVYSVKVFYVPAPTDLSADGDTFDGRSGWEEWVVLDAAIKVATKEERDITDLRAERDDAWAEIAADLPQQDRGAPSRVADVTGDDAWEWVV